MQKNWLLFYILILVSIYLLRFIYLFMNRTLIIINHIRYNKSHNQGGGADTLKFNLHIIGCAKKRAKKRCEFNQKMCEFIS